MNFILLNLTHTIKHLNHFALRSLLSLLGIMIGTASIVAIINGAKLATDAALSEVKSLGTDLVSVVIFKNQGESTTHKEFDISYAKWKSLAMVSPQIREIAPYLSQFQNISFRGVPLKASLIGADSSLAAMLNIKMESGHFLSNYASTEPVCVIGPVLADAIKRIRFENPIGKQIQINHQLFTIQAISAPWLESGFFNENINESIIIPIQSFQLISQSTEINHALIRLKAESKIEKSIQDIQDLIHQQSPNLNIFIQSPQQIINSFEKQKKIFTVLLVSVGGIILLVGGIGIMNMMLVSVHERRKEIGIRKAVGASSQDIRLQFLMEAAVLSLSGGILGTLLGLSFTKIIAVYAAWPFHIYLQAILLGFLVSLLTGLFFGFYPAHCAAKLSPMACLRKD